MEKDITDRIELILKVYELTPSSFSDLIQVQRSAMSHILSRRNRPSLDVIQKILKQFPDINSNWLLTGIGKMKQLDLFEDKGNEKEQPKKEVSKDTVNAGSTSNVFPITGREEPKTDYNKPELNAELLASLSAAPLSAAPVQEFSHPVIQPQPVAQPQPVVPPAATYSVPHSSLPTTESIPLPEVKKNSEPETPQKTSSNGNHHSIEKKEKEIEKIIIFYKDKTFSSYTPE